MNKYVIIEAFLTARAIPHTKQTPFSQILNELKQNGLPSDKSSRPKIQSVPGEWTTRPANSLYQAAAQNLNMRLF